MNRTMITMALLGAAGLVAACGGEGGDTGGTTEDSGAGITAPIDAAGDAAADLEKAASQTHTLTFAVDGMT